MPSSEDLCGANSLTGANQVSITIVKYNGTFERLSYLTLLTGWVGSRTVTPAAEDQNQKECDQQA